MKKMTAIRYFRNSFNNPPLAILIIQLKLLIDRSSFLDKILKLILFISNI